MGVEKRAGEDRERHTHKKRETETERANTFPQSLLLLLHCLGRAVMRMRAGSLPRMRGPRIDTT